MAHRSTSIQQALEQLQPHDHLCIIYETPDEWRKIVIPYLVRGLEAGERCVYVVDHHTADTIRQYLGEQGIDVPAAESSGQLFILHETEAYTRSGQFDPDKMIEFLIEATEQAVRDGYSCLRVTGEMTWMLRGHPGSEKLLEYEARLNRDLFQKYPCIAICQYDRRRFDPEIIEGVILTHPLLARGDHIYENFYYMPTDEYLGKNRRERQIQGWLDNLERERRSVAEQKQAQDELLRAKQEWELTFDSVPDLIAILDNEHRIIRVNGSMAQRLGKRPEQCAGLFCFECVHGLKSPPPFCPHTLTLMDGKEHVAEIHESNLGGDFLVSTTPLLDRDGRVVGAVHAARDITVRKLAEEALRSSHEELESRVRERTAELTEALEFNRSILEFSPLGINTFDSSGQCVFANDTSAEIYGGAKEQILQQNINSLDSWRQTGLLDIARRVLETGTTEQKQLYIKTVFGRELWLEHRLSRFTSGGEPHLLLVFDDITERWLAEEEIRKLNLDLISRTEELTHINEELESFSYSVSHDLRAPLRSINGFSRIIANEYEDKLDEAGKEYLQIITSECRRMGKLIDDLLALSRLSRKEISQDRVHLSSMAESIAAELRERQPEREVDFVITPGIEAYGDRVLLQSVLENLLHNAWKFTGKHPRARIEFGVAEQDGRKVYHVRDDGSGFDMKYAHKLFGAFQRLHAADEFPGNGIGLAIVQRIIHRHGGQVWADGAIDRGAAFYFTLDT
jgi:PAS domain S-box-containing protein